MTVCANGNPKIKRAAIGRGETHVWRIDLKAAAAGVELLDRAERARAQRLAFESERRRFVAARAALKTILGAYGGIEPGAVALSSGRYGKPELREGPDLEFNMSHSGDLALIAIARAAAVGVDVEQLRPLARVQALAARHFTPEERSALLACANDADRQRAFFSCWTRKEAYAKALGLGLGLNLSRAQVGLDGPRVLDGFGLASLDVGTGYAAALAVRGRIENVLRYRFTPNCGTPKRPRRR